VTKRNGICHMFPHVQSTKYFSVQASHSILLFPEDSARSDMSELQLVRAQLVHKTQLLDKVKILLQRAAAKEKMLHEKVRSGCQGRRSTRISKYPH